MGLIPGGPSDLAALAVGDILFSVNDEVLKGMSDLMQRIYLANPGSEMVLGVRRGSSEIQATLLLGKPEQVETPSMQAAGMPSNTTEFSVGSSSPPIVISIYEGSLAAESGLLVGDQILSINFSPVTTAEDALALLDSIQTVPVLIVASEGLPPRLVIPGLRQKIERNYGTNDDDLSVRWM